jgi:16S rRNA (uracil1498-N3)-methyltransferase
MTRRYYAPDLPASGGRVELSDEEARHAARVMRAQVGDSMVLFDGCGREAPAVVRAIDKRHCVADAAAPTLVDREPERHVHLAIGFPKPERAKEMVERLTELGVKQVTPLVCDRTQRPPTQSLLEKLRRIVIESSKQSERNLLMQINAPVKFSVFASRPGEGIRWIAHPSGTTVGRTDRFDTPAVALIGPEGGFTDDEVELAVNSGFQAIGLGHRVYRIETAAGVVATVLGYRFESSSPA